MVLKGFDIGGLMKKAEEGVRAAASMAASGAEEISKTAGKGASAAIGEISKAVDGIIKKTPGDAPEESNRNFVKLLWLLAEADGATSDDERAKIGEIGSQVDERYSSFGAELEEECSRAITEAAREFGRENAVKMIAGQTIAEMSLSRQEASVLYWNLLAVANYGELCPEELDYIRYVGERANLDKAVAEELFNYNSAIIELAKAREQLQSSARPYDQIHPVIADIEKREREILEAAQATISDK